MGWGFICPWPACIGKKQGDVVLVHLGIRTGRGMWRNSLDLGRIEQDGVFWIVLTDGNEGKEWSKETEGMEGRFSTWP